MAKRQYQGGLTEAQIKNIEYQVTVNGVQAINDLTQALQNQDLQLQLVAAKWNAGAIGMKEAREEAAKLTPELVTLNKQLQAAQDIHAGLGVGISETDKRLKSFSYTVLAASQGLEDFVMSGMRGVINNSPMFIRGLAEMSGYLNPTQINFAVAAISGLVTVAYAAGPALARLFNPEEPKKFRDEVEHLEDAIKQLKKEPVDLVNTMNLEIAEKQLEELKRGQQEFNRLQREVSDEDAEAGRAFSKIVRGGAGPRGMAGLSEDVARAIAAQQAETDPEMVKLAGQRSAAEKERARLVEQYEERRRRDPSAQFALGQLQGLINEQDKALNAIEGREVSRRTGIYRDIAVPEAGRIFGDAEKGRAGAADAATQWLRRVGRGDIADQAFRATPEFLRTQKETAAAFDDSKQDAQERTKREKAAADAAKANRKQLAGAWDVEEDALQAQNRDALEARRKGKADADEALRNTQARNAANRDMAQDILKQMDKQEALSDRVRENMMRGVSQEAIRQGMLGVVGPEVSKVPTIPQGRAGEVARAVVEELLAKIGPEMARQGGVGAALADSQEKLGRAAEAEARRAERNSPLAQQRRFVAEMERQAREQEQAQEDLLTLQNIRRNVAPGVAREMAQQTLREFKLMQQMMGELIGITSFGANELGEVHRTNQFLRRRVKQVNQQQTMNQRNFLGGRFP